MRRTRYSLVSRYLFHLQNIYVVLTWPTYYSIGKVQLTHFHGQALVEERWVVLTWVRITQPASTDSVFKETIRPGSPPGLLEPYGFALKIYFLVDLLSTHFSIFVAQWR
jgi:hypothetical protein